MKEFRGSQNYVASEELLRAANIAMVLQKPLLIKGEPGTGKTMLAEAISQALNSEREHQEKRIEEETIGEDREY